MLGRRSGRVGPLVAIAVVLVVAALELSTTQGIAGPVSPEKPSPSPTPHGVLVDRSGVTLRVFTDANCSVRGNRFTAVSKRFGTRLLVRIQPFTGFGRYALKAGTATGPYVSTFASFTDSEGHQYASNFVPPYRVPSIGAIHFGRGGQLIGVGFQPTFNSSGSEAIIFTGVMRCHYAKRAGADQ